MVRWFRFGALNMHKILPVLTLQIDDVVDMCIGTSHLHKTSQKHTRLRANVLK